ncbi:MAG: phosphatase PAP2 family protein [Solirubrobacteraceae bacterium]
MPLLAADLHVLGVLRTSGHAPGLERALARYSSLGEHAACWLAFGVAGSVYAPEPAARRAWRRGAAIVATSYAANYAVKLAVRRRRPELADLPPLAPVVSELSFPSAHATTSFAAARAYTGLAPAWALYGAAALFAISRPYLGVHYPSDVLAGALLGTLIAAAAGGGERGGEEGRLVVRARRWGR